jgi:hypothetical protein
MADGKRAIGPRGGFQTLDEVLANIREAAEGWIEVAADRVPVDPSSQVVEVELS